ncbi:ferredoxin [Pseudonocardia sp. GCM10023141]|uniref:ferredoxin n=1 Tax=Pseudonocardia sp. GCM10023141 TaxID=3252653 RepID=UPI00361E3009
MEIIVAAGRCQGHARCNALHPELFPLDDDGYIAIEREELDSAAADAARAGAAECPERAISVSESA